MAFKDAYWTQTWWALQDQVLAAANWVCADCGWPRAKVAHHTTYKFGVLCPPQYLVALCLQCHKVRHGRSNWRRENYEEHMKLRGFRRPVDGERWLMRDLAGEWVFDEELLRT
jgi:hypothetical protein